MRCCYDLCSVCLRVCLIVGGLHRTVVVPLRRNLGLCSCCYVAGGAVQKLVRQPVITATLAQ